MKRINKLKDIFNRLQLPADELLIAGSTPLSVFNILEEDSITDFDVLVLNKNSWNKVCNLGQVKTIKSKEFKGQRVVFKDPVTGETMDFINSWPMAGKSTQKLIDKKMEVDGLSFMSLEHVIRTKITMDRQKDRKHLSLMRKWLHETRIDSNSHLPETLQKRAYRDIARGLAIKIPRV